MIKPIWVRRSLLRLKRAKNKVKSEETILE